MLRFSADDVPVTPGTGVFLCKPDTMQPGVIHCRNVQQIRVEGSNEGSGSDPWTTPESSNVAPPSHWVHSGAPQTSHHQPQRPPSGLSPMETVQWVSSQQDTVPMETNSQSGSVQPEEDTSTAVPDGTTWGVGSVSSIGVVSALTPDTGIEIDLTQLTAYGPEGDAIIGDAEVVKPASQSYLNNARNNLQETKRERVTPYQYSFRLRSTTKTKLSPDAAVHVTFPVPRVINSVLVRTWPGGNGEPRNWNLRVVWADGRTTHVPFEGNDTTEGLNSGEYWRFRLTG